MPTGGLTPLAVTRTAAVPVGKLSTRRPFRVTSRLAPAPNATQRRVLVSRSDRPCSRVPANRSFPVAEPTRASSQQSPRVAVRTSFAGARPAGFAGGAREAGLPSASVTGSVVRPGSARGGVSADSPSDRSNSQTERTRAVTATIPTRTTASISLATSADEGGGPRPWKRPHLSLRSSPSVASNSSATEPSRRLARRRTALQMIRRCPSNVCAQWARRW
jgi:hypothetical protein